MVGDPTLMKAIVVVEQADAVLVQAGQPVRLMVAELPGVELSGVIERISQDQMQGVARELSVNNGGAIATKPSPDGGEQPMLRYYEATVPIEFDSDRSVLSGFRGTAKIKIDSAPLGQRLIRYVNQVIHFR